MTPKNQTPVKARSTKAKSPIFEAVHETARDFHRLGFISKRNMHQFDALCMEPPERAPGSIFLTGVKLLAFLTRR